MESKPSTADIDSEIHDWVDLPTASDRLSTQWGLGPEHSRCFRPMRHCIPECNHWQVTMNGIHELHHQHLEMISQTLGIRVLKAAHVHLDMRDGPYAILLSDGGLLEFDDFLPLLEWLRMEKDRQTLERVDCPSSYATRARRSHRL